MAKKKYSIVSKHVFNLLKWYLRTKFRRDLQYLERKVILIAGIAIFNHERSVQIMMMLRTWTFENRRLFISLISDFIQTDFEITVFFKHSAHELHGLVHIRNGRFSDLPWSYNPKLVAGDAHVDGHDVLGNS